MLQNELSYDCVIPSSILVNKNIELTAVKLYAFIRSLTKLHGYCFATNEYLSHLMKSDISSIKRWISMLKNEGYIDVETSKNTIHWQRRLYISERFKKSLRRLMDEPPPAHTCAPPSSPVSHITKEYSKEDKLKEREEVSDPTSLLFGKPRIYFKPGKLKQLEKDFGTEKIKEMIDRLDEYADINPKRFKEYADHAVVIRKWIREDAHKTKSYSSNQHIEENKRLAQKVIESFPNPVKDNHIQLQSKGILFCYTGCWEEINFTDNGFKEQLFSRLRKMGLPTNNL